MDCGPSAVFSSGRAPIAALCTWDGAEEDVSHITTELVSHLRTREFLEGALASICKTRKKTVGLYFRRDHDHLAQGLLQKRSGVYRRGALGGERDRPARFIIDTLKNLPPLILEPFETNPDKGMLMTSPTHAFILHPGWPEFKKSVGNRALHLHMGPRSSDPSRSPFLPKLAPLAWPAARSSRPAQYPRASL